MTLKVLGRALCALAALALMPVQAWGQPAPDNTLPRGIYEPSGRQQVMPTPSALVALDSVSGQPCLVGSTLTCLLPVSGGGGGGGSVLPFAPLNAAALTARTSSSRVAFVSGTAAILMNNGVVDLYYKLGTASVAATTSDFKLPAGRATVVAIGANTHVAAITATSTAELSVTSGTGTPVISGGGGAGGGGGGDASAANQTAPQANAGSDASKAVAVQGLTGGKPVGVTLSAAIPAGTNNIGDIDVLTLPALPAGSNTIGTVNIGTIGAISTAALQTTGNTSLASILTALSSATVCATDTGTCDTNAVLKRLAVNLSTLATSIASTNTKLDTVIDRTNRTAVAAEDTSSVGVAISQTTPGTTNGIRADTSGATGAAAPARADYAGVVSGGNVVGLIQADTSVKIDMSTATTTQLVALSSGKKIYVTAWDVVAAGTGNFKLVYGTGTNCGTGTTDLTAAYNLVAQAGIAKGSGLAPILIVPASNALCGVSSAAVQMSGSLAFTQF